MHLVVDADIAKATDAFRGFGRVTLFRGREIDKSNLREKLRDADALLVRSITPVDGELIRGTPIKFVGSATAGIDHVAIAELAALDVVFGHAPACNANAVSEYVLGAIALYCLKTNRRFDSLRVGVVGYGAVGSRVVRKLKLLGAECVINDPPKQLVETGVTNQSIDQAEEKIHWSDLLTTLAADVVSLHTPLTLDGPYQTRGLIDAEAVQQLNRSQLFINMARGFIVDERALLNQLQSNPELFCAIDCWESEPQVRRGLLSKAFLSTPHIAGHTIEARLRATRQLTQHLARVFECEDSWPGTTNDEQMQTLELPESSPVECLATIATVCCRYPEASTAFKHLGTRSEAEQPLGFESLRRHFAQRREFQHYSVSTTADAAFQQNLRELGFHTVN